MLQGSNEWLAAIRSPARLVFGNLLPDDSGEGGQNYQLVEWCECLSVFHSSINSLNGNRRSKDDPTANFVDIPSIVNFLRSKPGKKRFDWVVFSESGFHAPQLHRGEEPSNCHFDWPNCFITAEIATAVIQIASLGIVKMLESNAPSGWSGVRTDGSTHHYGRPLPTKAPRATFDANKDQYLSEMLVTLKCVTQDQIDQAAADPLSKTIGVVGVLLQQQLVTPDQMNTAFAQYYGREFVSLAGKTIAPEIIAMVRPDIAKRYKAVPISYDNGELTVGITDPSDLDTIESIGHLVKPEPNIVIITEEDLIAALATYYP